MSAPILEQSAAHVDDEGPPGRACRAGHQPGPRAPGRRRLEHEDAGAGEHRQRPRASHEPAHDERGEENVRREPCSGMPDRQERGDEGRGEPGDPAVRGERERGVHQEPADHRDDHETLDDRGPSSRARRRHAASVGEPPAPVKAHAGRPSSRPVVIGAGRNASRRRSWRISRTSCSRCTTGRRSWTSRGRPRCSRSPGFTPVWWRRRCEPSPPPRAFT